jgi:hypothetical protein
MTEPPLTQGSPLGASRPLLAVENPCQISYTAVHSTLVALSGMYMKRNSVGLLGLGGVQVCCSWGSFACVVGRRVVHSVC